MMVPEHIQECMREALGKQLDDHWWNIRDSFGKTNNPNWYPGMWELAWEEYAITASQVLKEDAV